LQQTLRDFIYSTSTCCSVPCPAGFIAPCLPTKAHTLPSGGQWLHEIKHDGFRVIARKNGPLRLRTLLAR